jgi:hypothetical protein
MHPDIQQFWKETYDTIYLTEFDDIVYWYVIRNLAASPTIAKCIRGSDKPVVYYFDDQEYTEEQMLRLIKLKAFL